MVPYVATKETLSSPHFSVTYRITSPRRRSSKSMSMSGMDSRSGLRNRSKISPCAIGSSSVMPSAYAISAPAADPRPGPTGTPFCFAHMMKSATTRKYDGYPLSTMTCISYSAWRACASSIPPGKRRSRPRLTSLRNQLSSVSPSGTGYFGMRLWKSNMPAVSTFSATTRVFRQPSAHGSDVSSPRIWSADLMK